MKSGIELIAEERARQIREEGFYSEQDDQYVMEELASAASCYATPHNWRPFPVRQDGQAPLIWPWSPKWWKPGEDRIKELQKAGALIAAEIDRIQRIKSWS